MKLVHHNLATEAGRMGAGTNGTTTDLLVFVLALPKPQGLQVWKEIRGDCTLNRLPIAILTAHSEEVARVLGFVNGTGDHLNLSKPAESAAHVKSLLSRVQSPENVGGLIEVGQLVIDPSSYRVTRAGQTVALGMLEFRLLYYLASRPNRLLTRNQLLTALWPAGGRFVNPRIVDAHICRLRVKIEVDPENPAHIKTQRGIGYLFNSAVEVREMFVKEEGHRE